MGIKSFQIEVKDNSILSYFPGETIRGILHFETDKPCKSKGISIRFQGKAEVRWQRQRGSREIRSVRYNQHENSWTVMLLNTATQEYFNTVINLSRESNLVIPEGHHEYPFEFILPFDLPSSFVSSTCWVWYEMEALMKHSKKSTCKARVPFSVNGISDLNRIPGASQSIEVRKFKNYCCFCCKSGPVGFILRIPRKGFVCGEFLQFTVEMSNQSRRKVNGATAYLLQHTTCHAPDDSETFEEIIRKVKSPSVEPGETEIWSGEILKIPPLPPTKPTNCKIIDIDYVLKIEMDVGGLAFNLSKQVPIIIGSIPLRSTFQSIIALQSSGDPTGQPYRFIADQTTFFQDAYPDFPPPSYAESIRENPQGRLKTERGQENPGFTGLENDPGQSSSVEPPPFAECAGFSPKYLTYT